MFTNLASNGHSENIYYCQCISANSSYGKLDKEKAESNHKDRNIIKLYEPIEKLSTNTVIFSNYQVIPKRYQPF